MQSTPSATAASPDPVTPVDEPYALYMCVVCGWIYDEAQGLPEAGIPAGTRWCDVPADFLCIECGEAKDAFERVES